MQRKKKKQKKIPRHFIHIVDSPFQAAAFSKKICQKWHLRFGDDILASWNVQWEATPGRAEGAGRKPGNHCP
jgi:hypothetical protein